jgi:hypothetical protein
VKHRPTLHLLVDASSDTATLEKFLEFDRFHPADSVRDRQIYSYGVKYNWDNVKLIRYELVFRRLLEVEPSLATHIVYYAMDGVD